MSTLEVPVTRFYPFGPDSRIANNDFAITLHKVPKELAQRLRKLLDANVPTTAHVIISREGVVALEKVEASSQVRA